MPELPKKKRTDKELAELSKLIPIGAITNLVKLDSFVQAAIVPDFKPVIFSSATLIKPELFDAIANVSNVYKSFDQSFHVIQLSKKNLISGLTEGLHFYNLFAETVTRLAGNWQILKDAITQNQRNLASMVEALNKPLIDPAFFRIITPGIHITRTPLESNSVSLPYTPTTDQRSLDYLEERQRKQSRLLDLQIVFYERQIAMMDGDRPGTIKVMQEIRPLSAVSLRNPTKKIVLQEPETISWFGLSLNKQTGISHYFDKRHKFALNKPHYLLLKALMEKQGEEATWSDLFSVVSTFISDLSEFDDKRLYVREKIRDIRRYFSINSKLNPDSDIFWPTGTGYKLIALSRS